METNNSQTVTFSIDSHGLRCVPEALYIQPGETISWIPPTGMSIMIQCLENTPFPSAEYQSAGSINVTVRADAPPGVYRFATAVAGEVSIGLVNLTAKAKAMPKLEVGDIGVWMDARCPRLIVD